MSFTFLPGWLRGLESRTTVGPITLVSDVLARCEAMLLESQVQFVVTHAHVRSTTDPLARDFRFVRIGSDMLIPVSAPDATGRPHHQPARATPGSPLALLGYSPESGIGRILREVRSPAFDRCPSQSVFTAHLASVLRTMALDGRGMAWLPHTLIAEDLAAGRLLEAAPQDCRIGLEIRLYRDRFSLAKAAEDFWAAVSAAA